MTKLATNVYLNVPVLRQNDNTIDPNQTCNTTCIAMVAQYFGLRGDNSMAQLEDQYSAKMRRDGYDRYDMASMTAFINDKLSPRANATFTQNESVVTLCNHIANGSPVIISGSFTPSWHFVVLRGYDLARKVFYVNDPNGEWFPTGYSKGSHNGAEEYSFNLVNKLCNDAGHDASIWAIAVSGGSNTGFTSNTKFALTLWDEVF